MRRRLKWVVWPLLAVALLLGVANAGGTLLSARNEKWAERDPVTGIMKGAEELDLGPKDAPGVVLFVHGYIGGSNNFNEVPMAVAEHGCRVRALRLPGHGTSPRDFKKETVETLLEAVRQELAKVKEEHETVVVVGHSMGASLALLAAAENPVDGMVLAAPYFKVPHRWYYLMPAEKWGSMMAPVVPWMYKGRTFMQVNDKSVKKDIFSYAWVPTNSVRTLKKLSEQVSNPELLKKIECPVLVLHGKDDIAASYDAAEEFFQFFPSEEKKWVELTKSSHHVFFDYDKELVKEEILEFLAGLQDKE